MNEPRLHQLFQVSVLLKAASAAAECVAGAVLAFVSPTTIAHWMTSLLQQELLEDPQDIIATHLSTLAHNLSIGSKAFYAFYLLSHGVVKLAVVVALLKGKLWAYPASLVVLGAFVVYQVYRYAHTHAAGLVALSVFDILVMALIWHEYGQVRRHLRPVGSGRD
jgi:uncharacterized membrane protein